MENGEGGPQLRPPRAQGTVLSVCLCLADLTFQGGWGRERERKKKEGKESTLAACAANPIRLLAGWPGLRLPPVWPMCSFLLVTGVHHVLGKC